MIITWHGHSCFKIQGDKATVITDPFDGSYGLKVPRHSADIVTVSHDHKDHNYIESVKPAGDKPVFVVDTPGEFEFKETFIYGIPSYHDNSKGSEMGPNTIYRIEMDGMSIGHLGDLGHTLESEHLERLEGVDILMIPIGGTYTIDGKEATKVINQIEPRIVIPMHYNIKGLKLAKKIDGYDVFCKEIGACPKEEVSKLKITKKDLPQEDLEVVLFES